MKTNWENRIKRNRRKRQLQLKVYKLCIMAVLIFMTVMTVTLTSKAASTDDPVYFKYYSNIIVQPGDSLESLAAEHVDHIHYQNSSSYISEIRFMNHLSDSEEISPGNYLIIPYYSTTLKR